MSIFYKLGAAQAVQQFTSQLDDGFDNPTTAPPVSRYTKTAVEQMLKKLAKKSKTEAYTSITGKRTRGSKSTNFKAMVSKLRKKKRKSNRC